MSDIEVQSIRALNYARNVIAQSRVVELWQDAGAIVHQVGSVRTGLLLHNRDIDFHIYSDVVDVENSFAVVGRLAANPRITRVEFRNNLNTDEKCVEWHAWYQDDEGKEWQIDMIHIRNDSPFAGYFENVAERISGALTPETRKAILIIKDALYNVRKVQSIAVYRAVLEGGVRTPAEFDAWCQSNPADGIIEWMP
ncbi:hypothetical protein [Oleidesulfovibrio sp.]|uniref:hypothetical protein n=1 Tax=Oleidesulfovibrio sp. TaxID=2909707 RepID=UPI003A856BC5